MAQAGGPVFSPVVARRPTRVSAAAASAGFLLLLAALVLANSSGRRGPFRASVEESAAAWARAQSAKNVALAKHTQVASSGPKTAPADPANLTPAARSHAQSRITGLKAEVEAEQHKASRLDATVSDEAAMIRDALLKAKKMQREATRAKTKAVERRLQTKELVKESGKLLRQSKEAKKLFVEQETPMEDASKLARSDHGQYRKAELEVAHLVTKLSEDPTDKKLASKVHKLVKEAQADRKHMDKDHSMLKSIEVKIGSMQLGKSMSYTAMKDESLALSKKAKEVKDTAQALKDESAHLQMKADKDVVKIETQMAGPEKLHSQAESLRARYQKQMAQIAGLKAELKKPLTVPALTKAARASMHTRMRGLEAAAAGSIKGLNARLAGPAESRQGAQDRSIGSAAAHEADSNLGRQAPVPAHSRAKARAQFLAGLFSSPWDKGMRLGDETKSGVRI